MALAHQACIAIERSRLYEQEIQQQRLEKELAVGRQIQLSLLPKSTPVIPGWEFSTLYQPARQVGGDLYDFFELPGEPSRLGLLIADVTGKGVPAALFMTLSRTIVRSEAMTARHPAEVLERTNQAIIRDSRSPLFLSAFYAVLDPSSGQLTYANGGHNWPLWLQHSTGECQELVTRSTILGAFKSIKLEEREVNLNPGDLLVFYTDGLTEARNPAGHMFGEERLRTVIAGHLHASAEQVQHAVVDALGGFSGNAPQTDDFTLLVVKHQK
jgi:sigma-B regulation protein RsbU (phosphoserine phosphatase)